MSITVRIMEGPDVGAIGSLWQALELQSEASFFQSWSWIGNWLQSMPGSIRHQLIVAERSQEVVGLGILVPQKVVRHVVFRSNALFLNEAGLDEYDFIVEHNGFLLKSGLESEVLEACLRYLVQERKGWDELFLSGIRTDNLLAGAPLLGRLGLHHRELRSSASPYVDLEMVRLSGGDYLSTISSNRRAQIRRSIRKYELAGALTLRVAATLNEAMDIFEDLKELHQSHWTARGEGGSFARTRWEQFHRNLINARFSHGEIQLARVSAGGKTIGCLYNVVRNGWVSVVQTGFRYEEDPDFRPGYVGHYLAIDYNLGRGHRAYDFLAGESRYKTSLSNKSHQLTWAVLQQTRSKFIAEDALRQLKRSGELFVRTLAGARLSRPRTNTNYKEISLDVLDG